MGKMTFVFEFEDGKEPSVGAGMDFHGGRIVSAAFFDYRDDFFTERQNDQISNAIDDVPFGNEGITHEEASAILEKLSLLTI
ncbi:hypothetical protein ACFL9S_10890 [Erwinia sp. AnSW2-5]|uniref:hypothetical protein n=1 Tax=Erwinia sp. AnSW2-5 TaxID=3367692 RepID=UPI00385AFDD4